MSWTGRYIKFLGKLAEQEIEHNVLALLPKGRDIVYLDCGCDSGEKTVARGRIIGTGRILGFESVTERAKLARAQGVRAKVVDLNGKWPLPDNSIDCITATEVVEHLIDLDNFFASAKRVLKKRGKLILSTENLAGWHNLLALILGNQPYTGPYLSKIYPIGHRPHAKFYQKKLDMSPHLNVMTSKALVQLLKAYGFKAQSFRPVGFYPLPPPLSGLINLIEKSHSSYIVIGAEK